VYTCITFHFFALALGEKGVFLKIANDKKQINSNNKSMYVINNPKGTHKFMIIFQNFQQKIFSLRKGKT
jgi:hypothetical protein